MCESVYACMRFLSAVCFLFALSTVFYIRLNIAAIINVRNKIGKVLALIFGMHIVNFFISWHVMDF